MKATDANEPLIDGICEITLEAPDPAALEAFYTSALGLRVLSRDRNGVWLACGPRSRLGLWTPGEKEFGDQGGRHLHFALGVTPKALDRTSRRLSARGIAFRGPVAHPGGDRSLYLEDPAGNVLELWDVFHHGDGAADGVRALSADDRADGACDVNRRLGFAVKVLGEPGLPSHDTRRWQSRPHLRVSLERLERILDYLQRVEIPMYRMPSALAPYATHPDLPEFHGQVEECAAELERLGARARRMGVRLSTHPGQYVVLNSASEDVSAAAVRDLELQARLLDTMGLGPEAVVVLHVGSAEAGRDAGKLRFLRAVEQLSARARGRLVIENDDRSFSLGDVLGLAEQTGIRVVWDILHHHCNDPDGIPDDDALRLAIATWPQGQTPKIHYSSPKTAVEERVTRRGRRNERRLVLPQPRSHADMVDPIAFEDFLRGPARGLRFDIMLEAKAKDAALLRLRAQLDERGIPTHGSTLRSP